MLSQTEEIYNRRQKEIEVRFKDYLAQNSISWKKVETVMAAMDARLIRADLSSKELDAFYEKLQQAGSLVKTIRQLQSMVNSLRVGIAVLKQEKEEH